MNALLEQVNVGDITTFLQDKQKTFYGVSLAEYLKLKPFLDMDVNKDDIIFYLSLDKSTDITMSISTEYKYGVLTDINIQYVEIDTDDGTYYLDASDDSDLILECKRIIHDAAHYKLLHEDDEIETDFYHEVYA